MTKEQRKRDLEMNKFYASLRECPTKKTKKPLYKITPQDVANRKKTVSANNKVKEWMCKIMADELRVKDPTNPKLRLLVRIGAKKGGIKTMEVDLPLEFGIFEEGISIFNLSE